MPKILTEDETNLFRDALCASAVELFAGRGYRGVTMRALAEEVGCSRSTPYHYFESKDAILAAVRTKAFGRLADGLQDRFDPHATPMDRVRALGWVYLDFAKLEPDAYRLMFDLKQPGHYPELRRERRRAHGLHQRSLEIAVEAGELRGEPEVLANSWWSSLHGLSALVLSGQWRPGPKLDRLYDQHLELVLRGMAA